MNKMGAGKMYRVNKNGQSSNNYGGGHTGKGKKGKSQKRDSKVCMQWETIVFCFITPNLVVGITDRVERNRV